MHRFPSLPRPRWLLLAAALAACVPGLAQAGVVVVAHAGVRKLDVTQVQRIFTGRVVELGGQVLSPVNLPPGHLQRQRFLNEYLHQDEDSYTAYWTVRRYVGKGVPPRELASGSEVIGHVMNTPGAIGYVDESEVPSGANIQVVRSGAASAPR
ncbi:hypothetical protein [Aquabacterium sp.]|uniref:hypothetical protein n=1 Tax=Aquabacterium sp. TaxID=1872578 RepID=UPI0035C76C52